VRGIKVGQHVVLMVGEEGHAARVEEIGDGHLVLGLARRPDEALVAGTVATVQAVDARGLHRVTGTLDPDKRELDVVTLRWQAVEDIQRRQYVRVEVTCIVEVRRRGRDPIPTFTVNVSGSGFLLAGPDDLEEGEEVDLTVRLDDGRPPLAAKVEVVRITGDGFRGVHILDIAEADRERLIHFVFERQRTMPRVRLS
jgi:hypothetical protein